ncbi:PREDICTED: uncharacterized protein LOC106751364 [Dinoponera quadriceps]|uniref:Uncharacterized protein LOC106751364 n=1 Tax=Dinoponera quadriceps TaxID=609295 RepID=A0A6P3Y9M7_DINQU|nr:PREDICTED: uncharacterized protein LOC106751364 [Dinoponera quadriceps]
MPLHVQKIILFMLQKGTIGYYVKLGGIFIGSIEGFASISLTLQSEYDLEELTMQISFLSSQYLYIFVGSYIAQEITNHNNHVFVTVYDIQWYVAPLHVQKIILFMLQKGTKAYYVKLGGIFVGSMEGFTSLLSATISYFTVIYSTRQ